MFSLVCCTHTLYSHLPQHSFLASTGISINICSPGQSDSQAKSFLYPVFRTILVFCLLCTILSLLGALCPLLSSVQFSHSVMSDSLRPHESQHDRSPCPSPSPGVHSNSCPSSRWCHPAISSSVVPFLHSNKSICIHSAHILPGGSFGYMEAF